MAWIGAATTVASLFMQAKGASDAAAAAERNAAAVKAAKEYEAKQLEQNAGQAIAASHRAALDQERQAQLVASRALAVAAAGGGGVSDPTIVRLLSKIQGEGAYRRGLAIYDGEDKARVMRMQAAARRFEGELGVQGGDAMASAYLTKGATGMVSGIGSLFSKYAGGGADSGASGGSGDSNLLLLPTGDFNSSPAQGFD